MSRCKSGQKGERERHYSRVVIAYRDGETSLNRVFKDRAKAEWWAERQKESAVGKEVKLEPFVSRPYERRRGSKTQSVMSQRSFT